MATISLSLLPFPQPLSHPNSNSLPISPTNQKFPQNSQSNYPSNCQFHFGTQKRSGIAHNSFSGEFEGDSQDTVEVLSVPVHWLEPSNALQESEWLRVALHKWLDDEYCPEPTNVDISKVAADSYYRSLLQKTTDLGEILLKMVRELETISYQESFHGAFSSANAAVSLIAQRIEED